MPVCRCRTLPVASRSDVGKLLNHSEGGITGIYDRFDYADEKAKAMAAWGERLEEIVSEKPALANVVRLQRRAEAHI